MVHRYLLQSMIWAGNDDRLRAFSLSLCALILQTMTMTSGGGRRG